MTDQPAPAATGNAYELLSKPIPEITDADLEIIVADLRRRRAAYQSGKKDAGAPKPVTTAKSKADATAEILAGLNLKL